MNIIATVLSQKKLAGEDLTEGEKSYLFDYLYNGGELQEKLIRVVAKIKELEDQIKNLEETKSIVRDLKMEKEQIKEMLKRYNGDERKRIIEALGGHL